MDSLTAKFVFAWRHCCGGYRISYEHNTIGGRGEYQLDDPRLDMMQVDDQAQMGARVGERHPGQSGASMRKWRHRVEEMGNH